MPSIKLNSDIRDHLREELLRHRFSKEYVALTKERAALAVAVWMDLYKPSERATIEALPKGWLPEVRGIEARFGTGRYGYDDLSFNGEISGSLRILAPKQKPQDPKFMRVAEKHKRCAKAYDDGHKLQVRHAALKNAEADLERRFKDASSEISAVLNSVSSTARLKEVWPEVGPFVAKFEKAAPALPSLPIASLNKALDLPVKEAA